MFSNLHCRLSLIPGLVVTPKSVECNISDPCRIFDGGLLKLQLTLAYEPMFYLGMMIYAYTNFRLSIY